MKKNIIIIILSILVVSLTGYIIYDKIKENEKKATIKFEQDASKENGVIVENNENKSDKETNIDISNNNENINDSEESKDSVTSNINIDLTLYENIITEDLSILLGKNSLSELKNQDILHILFEIYKNKYGFPKTLSKEELNNIHRSSVLKNLNFTHEAIGDYSIVHNYSGSPLFNYNNDIYEYANAGHSYETTKIINKELIDFAQKDNEVTISYKFVFLTRKTKTTKQPGMIPVYLNLYNTIEDIKNNKSFKEFSYGAISDEAGYAIALNNAKEYVKDNYDNIKNDLITYTYNFKIEDNNLILKDFYTK